MDLESATTDAKRAANRATVLQGWAACLEDVIEHYRLIKDDGTLTSEDEDQMAKLEDIWAHCRKEGLNSESRAAEYGNRYWPNPVVRLSNIDAAE